MSRAKLDKELLSEDIEGLNLGNLKKAYRRYKKDTGKFRRLNVRDPLDHIDFEINLTKELRGLLEQIVSGNYYPQRPLIHYSPKSNGISRPTVTLKIEDVIVYRFCVEQIDKQIITVTRQKNIRGGVMASPIPKSDDGDYYETWFKDWMDHNKAVAEALLPDRYIATTDISSYFDNVEVDVLIELLRETIEGYSNLLSLLFFFLKSVKLRYGYKTTLNTGLVQDDSDASRILAYFYLHTHDVRMIDFTSGIGGHFFRYVDDMNVVVDTEVQAKLALRTLTNSLRKLGLMASIEKTQISSAVKAIEAMKIDENDKLTAIEDEMKVALDQKKSLRAVRKKVKDFYGELLSNGANKDKSWIKLLRRFYNLASALRMDFLLDDLDDHLINYPSLMANRKMVKYFVAVQGSEKFDESVQKLIDYLESPENLYPSVETEAFELLNCLDIGKLSMLTQARLHDIASRLVIDGHARKVEPLCEYSKSMAAYLLYNLDSNNSVALAKQFLDDNTLPSYYKKCLVIIGLASPDADTRVKVKRKLRTETDADIKRLMFLTENIKLLKKNSVIRRYKKMTNYCLYFNEWEDNNKSKHTADVTVRYKPIRVTLVKNIFRFNN